MFLFLKHGGITDQETQAKWNPIKDCSTLGWVCYHIL